MRLNPAYHAILEYKKLSHSFNVQFCQDQEGASYCMIHLAPENTALTMAGKIYQPEKAKVPHISIYQYYKPSEKGGFSVFHYTWYGFIEEGGGSTKVVLHVYFSQVGQYLYCQLKNQESAEVIQPISAKEEKLIQRYAKEGSESVLDQILAHITGRYSTVNKLVDDYLSQLDDISQHLNTQFPKYNNIAELCIAAMQQKDLWSFGRVDKRTKLLSHILSITKEKQRENRHKKNKKGSGFYSQKMPREQEQKVQEQQQPDKEENRQNLVPEFQQELTKVEKELIENEQQTKISDVEKVIATLSLLNKKINLIQCNPHPSTIDKLIKGFQQINDQYKTIRLLFEKKALEGDIEAIKSLGPFISMVDISFFASLLCVGNVDICRYMVQEFCQCLSYLNYCAVGSKPDKVEETYTLLQQVLVRHDSPLLLEMLLQNGANPNFQGVSSRGLLSLSIFLKKEEFVRVLLENGADPNPKSSVTHHNRFALPDLKCLTTDELQKIMRQAQRASRTKQADFSFSNDTVPLFEAISTRNRRIIALLLEYGASVTRRCDHRFDALGHETCSEKYFPDLEIIKLLSRYGADINVLQGEGENLTTALTFACQRGDLNSVKCLIELGGDPNQPTPAKAQRFDKNNKNSYVVFDLPVTAFLKAVLKGHSDIVIFLMKQDQQPISFKTMAMTIAFLIRVELEVDAAFHVIFQASPMGAMILNTLRGRYNQDTVDAVVKDAYQQGQQYFRKNNYDLALVYFLVGLFFGRKESYLSGLYNLANCYKKVGEAKVAVRLFAACIEYAPESQIGGFAVKQLEGLLPSESAIIKPS
jgi:ankyrin repeat protein